MVDTLLELRAVAAEVARRARHVRIDEERIAAYAASLPREPPGAGDVSPSGSGDATASREAKAALWLTLDGVNFGSGWFPTLRKRPGHSGYETIAAGIQERFATRGPWSPAELERITTEEVARTLGQDPDHELMRLFTASLGDLGGRVAAAGGFLAVVDRAGGSAAGLVAELAAWPCFQDVSSYDGLTVPFLKRAQIAAADLHRSGVARFEDLDRLTMFADNLVPHVLRLDGILSFEAALVAQIDREELIEHGSPAEVEIRACALHAVELIVAQRPGANAAETDQVLWLRGRQPRYKARPRHRSRTTAY